MHFKTVNHCSIYELSEPHNNEKQYKFLMRNCPSCGASNFNINIRQETTYNHVRYIFAYCQICEKRTNGYRQIESLVKYWNRYELSTKKRRSGDKKTVGFSFREHEDGVIEEIQNYAISQGLTLNKSETVRMGLMLLYYSKEEMAKIDESFMQYLFEEVKT